MYEQFFGLRQNPFGMTPDPSFLFLTESHRETLAGLTYSIIAQKGFVVLTGSPGTGKTTLISTILQSIPQTRAHFTLVVNPTLTPAEFLELVLLDFGLTDVPASKAQRLIQLQQFLMQAAEQGKTSVLIIDEAHKLSFELLEEIRLLTNFETARHKLLQIVLTGQNELRDLINQPELRQLKQRIAVRLTINPLAEREVEPYLRHRWDKAGATNPLPFSPEAIKEIARASGGIPRTINAICENALMLGYGAGISVMERPHIQQVLAELDLTDTSEAVQPAPAPKPPPPPPAKPAATAAPKPAAPAPPQRAKPVGSPPQPGKPPAPAPGKPAAAPPKPVPSASSQTGESTGPGKPKASFLKRVATNLGIE